MIGISHALKKLKWADSRFLVELERFPNEALNGVLIPGEWSVARNVAHWVGTVTWYHFQLGIGPEVEQKIPATMEDVAQLRQFLETANEKLIAEGEKTDELLYWEENGERFPTKRSEVLWRAIAHSAEHKSTIVATMKVNGFVMDEERYGIWGDSEDLG